MNQIRTVIVGTKHRGAEALAIVARLPKGARVVLSEPENQADPQAVACYAKGEHVGYVPKNSYGPIVEALDAGRPVAAVIAAEALMQGGDIAPGGLPRIAVRID